MQLRRDTFAEFMKITKSIVGQPVVLNVAPYIIDRIHFWRIRWKRLHNDSAVRSKKISQSLSENIMLDCIVFGA